MPPHSARLTRLIFSRSSPCFPRRIFFSPCSAAYSQAETFIQNLMLSRHVYIVTGPSRKEITRHLTVKGNRPSNSSHPQDCLFWQAYGQNHQGQGGKPNTKSTERHSETSFSLTEVQDVWELRAKVRAFSETKGWSALKNIGDRIRCLLSNWVDDSRGRNCKQALKQVVLNFHRFSVKYDQSLRSDFCICGVHGANSKHFFYPFCWSFAGSTPTVTNGAGEVTRKIGTICISVNIEDLNTKWKWKVLLKKVF